MRNFSRGRLNRRELSRRSQSSSGQKKRKVTERDLKTPFQKFACALSWSFRVTAICSAVNSGSHRVLPIPMGIVQSKEKLQPAPVWLQCKVPVNLDCINCDATLCYLRAGDLLPCSSGKNFTFGKFMRPKAKKWKNKRLGFKHELILTLVDQDFTFREAEKVVETIFDFIKIALLNHQDVNFEGFGSWSVNERPPNKRRGYRFGKIVEFKRWKIKFWMEEFALLYAYDPAWRPHPSWTKARKRPKKLRGKKLAELVRLRKEEAGQRLYLSYVRTIVRFFADQLYGEDWSMFWNLRWNSTWYDAEAKQTRPPYKARRPIRDVAQIIRETRPAVLSRQWNNRVIDLITWYARWTTQLRVKPEIWKEAERETCELLKQPHRWAMLSGGTADE